jgi:hypothetical protein
MTSWAPFERVVLKTTQICDELIDSNSYKELLDSLLCHPLSDSGIECNGLEGLSVVERQFACLQDCIGNFDDHDRGRDAQEENEIHLQDQEKLARPPKRARRKA